MTFVADVLPALIAAGGAIGGGYLASSGSGQGKESKIEKRKRKLIDEILGSLGGGGKFGDLYRTDEEAFNKSFVQPAQSRFRNQIAPGIQQEYIYGGQQRGTGMEDQLLRAGVDMDSLINQYYMDYVNKGQDRKQSAINAIYGVPSGPTPGPTSGESFQQSAGGYLTSEQFGKDAQSLVNAYAPKNQPTAQANPYQQPTRKGYLPDYGIGDPRWGAPR
jgi:hypothetical protein